MNFFYSIIIYPLYEIDEFFYSLCYGTTDNTGLSIAGISLLVSFLCLPLYIVAEKWQEKERLLQKDMEFQLKKIKSAFHGEERYMMVSTYYRQKNYHPMMALRSSISLIIQIPFFIAAYKFLSTLESLQGQSFLFIKDLSRPDNLFYIGSFPVNILPIAMTLINIIASAIYTKGHPLKEKVQIYLMALFFLVFLYNSPSGLVFYWTANNVFSLVKNIFYKIKNPKKVLYILLSLCILALDFFLIFIHDGFLERRLLLACTISLFFFTPLFVKAVKYLLSNPLAEFNENSKVKNSLFLFSCITLCILCGLVLPSSVIASSPQEFSFIENYSSPFYFLFNTFFQSIGFFIVWPISIYFLFGKKIKSILSLFFTVFCLCSISNAFIFGGSYGNLSLGLQFSNAGEISPSFIFAFLSISISLILIFLAYLLIKFKKTKVLTYTFTIILTSLLLFSVYKEAKIAKGYKTAKVLLSQNKNEISDKPFTISKKSNNVLIIFLDRAISGFLPYMIEEDSTLQKQFTGFTYFPNTASFSYLTLLGAPPLYGGYEYTPEKINERENEKLIDKYNEALKVLPYLFDSQGYDTRVTDLSWANFQWIPDLRIFDERPSINKIVSEGYYTSKWQSLHPEFTKVASQAEKLKRSFLYLSFFKIINPLLRKTLYDEGNWWSPNKQNHNMKLYLDRYSVLDMLPSLTEIQNDEKNVFLLLANNAPHDPVMLGETYVPSDEIIIGEGILDGDADFNANFGAIKALGRFMEFLQKNDCYDNSRIIIVADHGGSSGLDETWEFSQIISNAQINYLAYNPLLMYKDFHSKEDGIQTDWTFMTNADVPLLATSSIMENAKNPFSGKKFEDTIQKDEITIVTKTYSSPEEHTKNKFKIEESWTLRDDIFSIECWKKD